MCYFIHNDAWIAILSVIAVLCKMAFRGGRGRGRFGGSQRSYAKEEPFVLYPVSGIYMCFFIFMSLIVLSPATYLHFELIH